MGIRWEYNDRLVPFNAAKYSVSSLLADMNGIPILRIKPLLVHLHAKVFSKIAVSTKPGQTTLARTPYDSASARRTLVSDTTAVLAAAYGPNPGAGTGPTKRAR
jgi:hypothetical protein